MNVQVTSQLDANQYKTTPVLKVHGASNPIVVQTAVDLSEPDMSRNEDGFTMIEVIVAAFCLALIVGAVATLFVSGNRSSLAGQRQAALIAVADQQIE